MNSLPHGPGGMGLTSNLTNLTNMQNMPNMQTMSHTPNMSPRPNMTHPTNMTNMTHAPNMSPRPNMSHATNMSPRPNLSHAPNMSPRPNLTNMTNMTHTQNLSHSPSMSPRPSMSHTPNMSNAVNSLPATTTISNAVGQPKPGISDTIRQLENQIASYGPGPHTQHQREEIAKLTSYVQRAKAEQQKQQQQQQQQQQTPFGPPQMMNAGNRGENSLGAATISPMLAMGQAAQNLRPAPIQPQTSSQNGGVGSEPRVLDKRRLQELVKEVDPLEQLDDDVEDVLLQIADDFIENVVTSSCQIAKHRKSNTLEAKDVQLFLERSWNMWVPGFGSEEIRPFKKAAVTEAHKQRMALIRKTLKKY